VSAVPSVKTAIVTGAAGGIGSALCVAFGQAGYRVIGCDRREEAAHCDVFLHFDVRTISGSAADREAVFTRIREALAGEELAVLVNNAAVQVLGSSDTLTTEDWRATLDTNVLVPFLLVQGLLPDLERAGGSVVNVASVHARLTKPGFVCYATSKAALVGLTRSLAVDLGGRVRVNAVLPAATATPMLLEGLGSGDVDALGALHPLGRIARPEEIAAAVVYLASGAASFVNGAVLAVDGGVGARLHDLT
jgi:NAD(P)-dependent dehydrogenase (short-subunit alcohol dehydrogenase family)